MIETSYVVDAIEGVWELVEFFGLRVVVRCIVCVEREYL
jgi:hypothetical protein